MKMDTKRLATNAILIAIGAILHQVTPPLPLFGIPMQPDLSLVMLFIIMIYNKDYKTSIICGIAVGIFAAATTKLPNGQIPNIVDKFITCNIVYLILTLIRDRISKTKQAFLILPLGTIISGIIFISMLMILGGMEATLTAFTGLFASVVLTTAGVNVVIGIFLFKITERTIATTGAYSVRN